MSQQRKAESERDRRESTGAGSPVNQGKKVFQDGGNDKS